MAATQKISTFCLVVTGHMCNLSAITGCYQSQSIDTTQLFPMAVPLLPERNRQHMQHT
jgi:hypothetical protein